MEKKIYETKEETVEALAEFIYESVLGKEGYFSIALSGGSTPADLFTVLSGQYSEKIPWERVKIFWVDERCVPPDHKDSNYAMTVKTLLQGINIPESNVFRMRGEDDPSEEARRYSRLLAEEIDEIEGIPSFDLILLGMGDDGHTASIFPDRMDLLQAKEFCVTAVHPENKVHRISLSGSVINQGKNIVFLICGAGKRTMLSNVLAGDKKYPASHINPENGALLFYLDKSAAV